MSGEQHEWTAARQAASQGDLSRAGKHFLAAAKRDKRNALLFLEAGVNAAQLGELTQAKSFLMHGRKLAPDDADINFNLGHVALLQDDFHTALKCFQQTRASDSSYPDLDYSIAEAAFALDDVNLAYSHVSKAVEQTPGDLDALLLKARCEQRLGDHAALRSNLEALLNIQPGHLDARLMLASHFAQTHQPRLVQQHLELAERTPDLPLPALLRIGDIYGRATLPECARSAAEKALALDPANPSANVLMATVLTDTGDFDAAERHYRKGLELDAGQTLAYQGLADIKRLVPDDLPALEKLSKSKGLNPLQLSHCAFALYHLYDRAGRHDDAFKALTSANQHLNAIDTSDVAGSQANILRMRSILSPDFLNEHAADGYPGEGCVFIIGMPRSGTTLAEQLLAGHPSVHAGGERSDMIELRRSVADFPDGLARLPQGWANDAGRKIHAAMFAEAGDCAFATDKLPGNYAFAGLIKWILPNARFIYCHRTPQANALSLFEQHFSTLPFSRDLKDIALAYNTHLKLIDHWRNDCRIDMFDLDYDAFVQDPEPIAQRLYEFVGLDWDARYLDITKVARPISTASRWQARQPINAGSVERWRRYESHLRPFTEALETN